MRHGYQITFRHFYNFPLVLTLNDHDYDPPPSSHPLPHRPQPRNCHSDQFLDHHGRLPHNITSSTCPAVIIVRMPIKQYISSARTRSPSIHPSLTNGAWNFDWRVCLSQRLPINTSQSPKRTTSVFPYLRQREVSPHVPVYVSPFNRRLCCMDGDYLPCWRSQIPATILLSFYGHLPEHLPEYLLEHLPSKTQHSN